MRQPFHHDLAVRRKRTLPSIPMTDMPAPNWPPTARGYFAIGAERMSKSLNLGNLMRSAHGFGASFTFTVGATYRALEAFADTSKSQLHLPHYNWARWRTWRCRRAASSSASNSLTALSICRASGTRCGPPMCSAPSRARCRRRAAGALRLRRAHPDQLLRQRRHGRRHRHVRSDAHPRPLCRPADAGRRPGCACPGAGENRG